MPNNPGELGDGGLRIEAVYIAELGDDAGRIDLAGAWDGGKVIGG